jgi:AcrR family transcriptional regulator
MPRGFTGVERQAIRQRLVDEGYDRFSQYGLKKTSVSELAEAAGISKGSFYLFYPSKEALFMDVTEKAEEAYRAELLGAIELSGPSPRQRLFRILKKAFDLLDSIPILQLMTSSDYSHVLRSIPAETLAQHLASDRLFFEAFIAKCQAEGIPIRLPADDITRLLYPIVLAKLHEDELGTATYGSSIDVLLELIAALCLGEIELNRTETDIAPAVEKA